MMHPPKVLLFVAGLGVCAALPAGAQSIGPSDITAAGGSTTTSTMTHEYAVGQVVAGNTFSSAGLVVTPGVLQPVFSTTGVAPRTLSQADMNVYPNPAAATLYLQPGFMGGGTLAFSLYDAAGRLVLQQEAILKLGTERQSLQVSALAAGQYSLQVSWLQGGVTSVAAYKIQKLQ